MSRFFVGLALWALLLALAACGGDSKGTDPVRDAELANDSLTESIQNKDSDSAKDAEFGENVNTVVPSFDDLPSCTRDHEGATAYVEDEDSAYVCKKGLWVVDDSLTKAVRPDSEEKSSSSAKAKSSSNETSDSSSSDKSRSSSSAVKTSSSSKDGKSSSSDEKNSSSSSVALPCKTETEDNCEYGTLTDDRDGQTYKTVKIGEQWWMAENLNYAYTGVPFKYVLSTDSNLVYYSDSTSWCINDSAEYCTKYGRLYTWSAAMDSSGILPGNAANGCGYDSICSPTYPVRGVCPEGWHLPDSTEWFTLFTAVGGKATAAVVLRSTEGWNDIIDNNGNKYDSKGSDNFGFSALPAGRVRVSWLYDNKGINADFWSSTEYESRGANIVCLNRGNDYAYWFTEIKNEGYSVRCVKD